MTNKTSSRVTRALQALAFSAWALGAMAQASDKSVVAEPVAAIPAFNQWLSALLALQPAPTLVSANPVAVALSGGTATLTPYQPLPVIVGLPELPLVCGTAAQAARHWLPSFNYQGVHMQQIVLNAAGTGHEARPMSRPLRQGERFKIRVISTFDAIAAVDQVIGDAWYGQRTGQMYPRLACQCSLRPAKAWICRWMPMPTS